MSIGDLYMVWIDRVGGGRKRETIERERERETMIIDSKTHCQHKVKTRRERSQPHALSYLPRGCRDSSYVCFILAVLLFC